MLSLQLHHDYEGIRLDYLWITPAGLIITNFFTVLLDFSNFISAIYTNNYE